MKPGFLNFCSIMISIMMMFHGNYHKDIFVIIGIFLFSITIVLTIRQSIDYIIHEVKQWK